MARQWLPVVDNLDRALEHAEADPAAIIDGVRAVRDQALDVLARLGFPRRDDRGARFDPARHEAVGLPARPRRRGRHGGRGRPAGLRRRRPPAAAGAGGGGRRIDGAGLMADGDDFYQILGVPRDASQDEIQRAYRKLARTLPPGRQPRPGSRGPVQGGLRGLRRPVRSADAAPVRRVRAGLPPGSRGRRSRDAGGAPGPARGAGAGRRGGPAAGPRRRVQLLGDGRHRPRGPAGRHLRRPAAGGAGARVRSRAPTRRPSSSSPSRRPTGAAAGRSRCPGDGSPPLLRRHDPGRGDRRAADPAGRAGRPRQRRGAQPATCTSSCGSRPHPRYRLDGRDLYVELPLAPWEAALGTSVAGGHPGRRGQGQGPGRDVERPAAAAARPRPAQPAGASRATCTPRQGSWCRPGSSRAERRLFEQLAAESDLRPEESSAMTLRHGPRPPRLSLDDVRRGCRACTRTWSAGSSPSACSTPHRDAAGRALVPPQPARRGGPDAAAARRASRSTTRPSGWSPTCSTGSRYSKRPCAPPRRRGR